jgi:hypothetical protein
MATVVHVFNVPVQYGHVEMRTCPHKYCRFMHAELVVSAMSNKSRPLTEDQWLNGSSHYSLLRYLQQHRRITKVPGGRRQLCLFKIACCRLVWDQIVDERSRHAVEVCERHIDGKARRTELAAAQSAAIEADEEAQQKFYAAFRQVDGSRDVVTYLNHCATSAARWTAEAGLRSHVLSIVTISTTQLQASRNPDWSWGQPPEKAAKTEAVAKKASESLKGESILADLVRCIFGNPFQPAAIDEARLHGEGSTVKRMASAIYEDRAFDRLPILSDLLEEAGCTERAILNHCRDGKSHARGCWVVDALVQKR